MKQIFLLLFTLTTTSLVNAQVLKSIGFKGGVSVANQSWHYKAINTPSNKDNLIGLYGAATFEFLKSKYFSLTTDLGYCAKGSSEKIPTTTNDMPEGDGTYKNYNTNFDYFFFSPILKIRYEINRFAPYALLGLRMDYQLSYKSDIKYEKIEDDFHKMIWGSNFGAGMEYRIKKCGVYCEGQYQYDFSKVLDTPSSATNTGIEIQNNALVVCLGLRYYLMKKEKVK